MKKVIGIVGGITAVAALAFGLYKYVEAGDDAHDDILSKKDKENESDISEEDTTYPPLKSKKPQPPICSEERPESEWLN